MKTPEYIGLVPHGDARIGVRFSIPHGKGHRCDTVAVPIGDILTLADAYRGCLRNPDHLHPGEKPFSAGHATWHVDNQDAPIPCVECAPHSPPVDLPGAARNIVGIHDEIGRWEERARSDKGPFAGHDQSMAVFVSRLERANAELVRNVQHDQMAQDTAVRLSAIEYISAMATGAALAEPLAAMRSALARIAR